MEAKKLRSYQKIARAGIVTFEDAILVMEAQMLIAKLRKASPRGAPPAPYTRAGGQ